MPSPIRPSEICALVPSGTSSLCDRILKVFIQLPAKLCSFFTWMFNENGTLTGAFIREVAVIPVGTVVARLSTVVPNGWLNCDGSPVSRTTYAELFAIIGTIYGVGDGTTTFNLPNFQDKFLYGKGATSNVGDGGGEETHVLTATEARPGTLTVTTASMNKCDGGSSTENLHDLTLNGVMIGGHVHDGVDMTNTDIPLGTGTVNAAHENRPPFSRIVWIVKT